MKELADALIEQGILKTETIISAFKAIDRKDFVLEKYKDQAYNDYPLSIGFNQTISQPSTVAFMMELLQPKQGEKILDVGSGSGWTTAILAQIAGKEGKVFGVEIIPQLVLLGKENISKYDFKNVSILEANKVLGLPKEAPFNKILVSAASRAIPQELVEQLKIGGIMVIPVQDSILKIQKITNKEIKKEKYEGFVFVPLL